MDSIQFIWLFVIWQTDNENRDDDAPAFAFITFSDNKNDTKQISFLIFDTQVWLIKMRCNERFTHAFTACSCVFKVIT